MPMLKFKGSGQLRRCSSIVYAAIVVLVTATALRAQAQSTQAAPGTLAFEVVSIKPAPQPTGEALQAAVTQGHILSSGSRRARRYELTAPGRLKAYLLANQLTAAITGKS